jgi:hypothetical protein
VSPINFFLDRRGVILADDLVKEGRGSKICFRFWSCPGSGVARGAGMVLGRDRSWVEGRKEEGMCRATETYLCLFEGSSHVHLDWIMGFAALVLSPCTLLKASRQG